MKGSMTRPSTSSGSTMKKSDIGLDQYHQSAEQLHEQHDGPGHGEARDAPPLLPRPPGAALPPLGLAETAGHLHLLLLGHADAHFRHGPLALLAQAPSVHAVAAVAPAEEEAGQDGGGNAGHDRDHGLDEHGHDRDGRRADVGVERGQHGQLQVDHHPEDLDALPHPPPCDCSVPSRSSYAQTSYTGVRSRQPALTTGTRPTARRCAARRHTTGGSRPAAARRRAERDPRCASPTDTSGASPTDTSNVLSADDHVAASNETGDGGAVVAESGGRLGARRGTESSRRDESTSRPSLTTVSGARPVAPASRGVLGAALEASSCGATRAGSGMRNVSGPSGAAGLQPSASACCGAGDMGGGQGCSTASPAADGAADGVTSSKEGSESRDSARRSAAQNG
eukprot:scaffold18450_cov125-Isochrysis_galbana.AAC.5